VHRGLSLVRADRCENVNSGEGKNVACTPFYQFAEWQRGLDQACSTLGGVPPKFVVDMKIEVADEYNNGIAVSHVCRLIPPVAQPVSCLWGSGAILQSKLQFCSEW